MLPNERTGTGKSVCHADQPPRQIASPQARQTCCDYIADALENDVLARYGQTRVLAYLHMGSHQQPVFSVDTSASRSPATLARQQFNMGKSKQDGVIRIQNVSA